jgi:dimethylhistidine N-methyltransferase
VSANAFPVRSFETVQAPPSTDQDRAAFLRDALKGLSRRKKELPCKYFYDEIGSELFDRICDLPEYYLTRTEKRIMSRFAPEMAKAIGPEALLVEFGSGSSLKTRYLLDVLEEPAGYIPVEISREHLFRSAARLAKSYARVPVLPVVADFTKPFRLPKPPRAARRRVVYFPGSTIGNLTPEEALRFLSGVRRIVGPKGGLLIGVDLEKDRRVLEAAYNDRQGVTAAFNLNLLARMNRELGADFDLDLFRHEAVYDPVNRRIEMHLVSEADQVVRLDGNLIHFRDGESVLTEYSHKYRPEDFARLAGAAGFRVEQVWTDERRMFSVQYLSV